MRSSIYNLCKRGKIKRALCGLFDFAAHSAKTELSVQQRKELERNPLVLCQAMFENALALFGSVYVRCFRRMLYRQMHRIFSLRESNACRLSQPRSHDDLSAKRLPFPPSTTASSAQRWLVPSRTWKGVHDKQKECLHRRLFRQAMLKYLNYVRTYFPT